MRYYFVEISGKRPRGVVERRCLSQSKDGIFKVKLKIQVMLSVQPHNYTLVIILFCV